MCSLQLLTVITYKDKKIEIKLKDYPKCAKCKCFFHFACSDLKELDIWEELGPEKDIWECRGCLKYPLKENQRRVQDKIDYIMVSHLYCLLKGIPTTSPKKTN